MGLDSSISISNSSINTNIISRIEIREVVVVVDIANSSSSSSSSILEGG